MSLTLKMANAWRILRDVNLDAIRASAEAPFVLAIVSEEPGDAKGLAALLNGQDEWQPDPAIALLDGRNGIPDWRDRPLAAILIARGPALTPALVGVRETLAREGTAIVTVVIGEHDPGGAYRLETSRIATPSIDSQLSRDVVDALVKIAGPEHRMALARRLLAARTRVTSDIIEETAQANASYALASGLAEIVPVLNAPMNLGDMVILTKNQLIMGYRLALACGMPGDPRRLIPEILGVIGGGLLFRQIARQLIGLIPVLGIAPKVAVSYAGTYAIGRAVTMWAMEGREVSAEAVRRFSREGLTRGREVARTLTRRPSAALPESHQLEAPAAPTPADRDATKRT
jgi:uncharacterized protein (DUF697 family)